MATELNKLPALLRRYKQLCQESVELRRTIADVEREIVAVGAPRRRKQSRKKTARAIQELVDVLRTSAQPLTRHELADRLNLLPGTASARLFRAVEMQLVERADRGRYRCVELQPRNGTTLA